MAGDTHPKRDRKKQDRNPERVLSTAFIRTVRNRGGIATGLAYRCWIQRLTIVAGCVSWT